MAATLREIDAMTDTLDDEAAARWPDRRILDLFGIDSGVVRRWQGGRAVRRAAGRAKARR